MKNVFSRTLIAAAVFAPALSFAQSAAPVSRASVRAEIVQLENAGYSPAEKDIDYPAKLQAAEAKIAKTQRGSTARVADRVVPTSLADIGVSTGGS